MYSLYDITRGCHNLGPTDAFDVKENHVREKFDLMNQMDVYDGMSPECTDDMHGLPAYQMENHQETTSYKMAAQQRMPANDTYLNDTPSNSQPMPGQKSIDEGISTHFLDAPSYDELPSQPIVTDGMVSSYQTGASQEVVKTDQVATREWMSVYQMGVNERMPSTQMGTQGMSQGTKSLPIHQMGTHRTMTTYQMGTHGTMTSCQMGPHGTTPTPLVDAQGTVLMSNQGAMLTQQMGTHGTIAAHEMSVSRTKHACRCSCHVTQSSPSHFPAFGLKNQRPSVIMVPQRWKNIVSDEPSKDDSESSDADDDEEKNQKYFRKNIDGTTAKFKLSKDDWGRIPINTFPSGGRLLSGDWTQIFLTKVKESNPWCSLRFKNNHVRSENSRKIHSAVFFRGGAECKRPECSVKVRFVIRKEKGRHVDVTYVGNVCHNSQPGGSDVTNDKRRNKRVRRARYPSC